MGLGVPGACPHASARTDGWPGERFRTMRSGSGVADFLSVQVTMIVSFCRDMTSQLRNYVFARGYSIV